MNKIIKFISKVNCNEHMQDRIENYIKKRRKKHVKRGGSERGKNKER